MDNNFEANNQISRSPNNFLLINLRDTILQKQQPKVLYKKAVLKNFAIFTGKHLCWSLFLIKLQALRPILKNIWERLLLILVYPVEKRPILNKNKNSYDFQNFIGTYYVYSPFVVCPQGNSTCLFQL